ncbi:MAG: zinc-ribbon domain-containing protein, partial [bacterium]|nr:zinc-ribbon domain-containing protein [bacterium]
LPALPPRLCPDCHAPLLDGAHFCHRCGAAPQPLPPHSFRSAILARIALICSLCGPLLLGIGWLLGAILAFIALLRSRRLPFAHADRRTAWWAVSLSFLWLVLIGSLAAVLSWHFFLNVRIRWNEEHAEQLLRSIALTQFYVKYAELFDADNDGIGEFVDFSKLAQSGYHLFPHDLASNPVAFGYYFSLRRADEQSFLCIASPWRYGLDGRRSFWIDERGILFSTNAKNTSLDRTPPSLSDLSPRDSLLTTSAEELAGDLAQAAESAFKQGHLPRCKRIIETIRRLFPTSAAAQRIASLEQTTDPFLMELKARELLQRASDLRTQNLPDQAIELLRSITRQFPASASAALASQRIAELTYERATLALLSVELLLATNLAEQAASSLAELQRRYPEAIATPSLKERIALNELEINRQLEQAAAKLLADARAAEATNDFETAYSLYLSVKNRYGKTSAASGVDDHLDKTRRMIEEREASRLIDEILALSPENDTARILALLDLLKRGYARTDVFKKNERILSTLQQTCRAQSYLAAARQQLQDKSYRAALANFLLAIEEAPGLALSLKDSLCECYLHLANAAYESQEYLQALDYYQAFLKLQPTNTHVNPQRLMECSFQAAKIKLQNNDFNDAERLLLSCSSHYAKNPEFNLVYGRTLMNLHRWDEAITRFANVLSSPSPFAREARLYSIYCQTRLSLFEEDVLRTMLEDDDDLARFIRDYGISFTAPARTNFAPPSPHPRPKSSTTKTFAELTLELCATLDLLAAEAERLTQLDRSRPDQLLAQRSKVRSLAQEFPSFLNVLRATTSADSYRKNRILDKLRQLRRHLQSLSSSLASSLDRHRNQELQRLAQLISLKLASVRKAEDSLEQFINLEDQRRRTIITTVENTVVSLRATSPNPAVLKSRADEIRSAYTSPKETDLAVDALRALAEAYQILPDALPLLIADPSTTEPVKSQSSP